MRNCFVLMLVVHRIGNVRGSFSLSLLRASTTTPPPGFISPSLSLDSLVPDTFDPPSIRDFKVEQISSENIPLLQDIADEAAVKKRESQYTSLSEDQLKIDVKMGTIESPIRYLVTPPPSTCEGATGPAAKLLDCVTTFPRVVIQGV